MSVRERMSIILSEIKNADNVEFGSLFDIKEGRLGVVVTFLALLELVKEGMVDIGQNTPFSKIYIGIKL